MVFGSKTPSGALSEFQIVMDFLELFYRGSRSINWSIMLNLVVVFIRKGTIFCLFFFVNISKDLHTSLWSKAPSNVSSRNGTFSFWLARNSFIKYLDYYCLDFLSKVHHMNAMTKHKTTYSYCFLNQSLRATRWQKEKKQHRKWNQ